MNGLAVLTLAAAVGAATHGPRERPSPGLTFLLSFGESRLDADLAAGSSSVVEIQGKAAYVDGVQGRALVLSDGPRLLYERQGNLSTFAGTVAAWIRVDRFPAKMPGTAFTLFAVGGAGYHGMLGPVDGWLAWRDLFYSGRHRGPERRFVGDHLTACKPGQWHLVAAAWEGKRWAFFLDDGPPCVGYAPRCLRDRDWGPTFSIGAPPRPAKKRGYRFLLNEVRIYDGALRRDDVARLYRSKVRAGGRPNPEND